MFLFLCQYHIILITVPCKDSLKSGSVRAPALVFFLGIALAIHDLLWFPTNFRIILVLWKMSLVFVSYCAESVVCFRQCEYLKNAGIHQKIAG